MSSKLLIICAVLIIFPLWIFAQDEPASNYARIELGLGGNLTDKGGGISGRAAAIFIKSRWGIMIRATAYEGGSGENTFWAGTSKEQFYDNAILVSRVLSKNAKPQFIASVGYGSFYGNHLVSNLEFEKLDRVGGLAYELGFATTGSTVGLSINIIGNINSDTSLIGIVFSITFGSCW